MIPKSVASQKIEVDWNVVVLYYLGAGLTLGGIALFYIGTKILG